MDRIANDPEHRAQRMLGELERLVYHERELREATERGAAAALRIQADEVQRRLAALATTNEDLLTRIEELEEAQANYAGRQYQMAIFYGVLVAAVGIGARFLHLG